MEINTRLGIIGCGSMGEAIVKGVVSSNLIYGRNIFLYDIAKDKSNYLKDSLNANAVDTLRDLIFNSDTILIAVKPQDIDTLLRDITHIVDSSRLVISIAAGVTIKRIKRILREEVRVVRVMPNIAALVKQSISAICYCKFVTDSDKDIAIKIFESIGDLVEVDEDHMDVVTAVSGSGPAYFFYLVELLEQSAISMGIDQDKARQLAVKTAFGSSALLKDSGLNAETLRSRVTSKGGTTEAAFDLFEQKKLGEILKEGIKEAALRAKELSEGKK